MIEVPDAGALATARERLAGRVHETPVFRCRTLDTLSGATLHLKAESLQRAGAFKIRGATNAVRALADGEAARGVATHSSGNHAAALSLAARERGIPAWIVMPADAPAVKRAAVKGYGGRIETCAPTLEAREEGLARVVARTGARFVHPFDDPLVVAGQATVASELLEQSPDVDVIVAPIGGGGLLAGISLAATGARGKEFDVIGAEPAGADDACRSLLSGVRLPSVDPRTVADGLRTGIGVLPFEILSAAEREILTVDDAATLNAMRLLWERAKLVVEPSGAVALAAVLVHRERFAGRTVGIVLSGGNVDVSRLFPA